MCIIEKAILQQSVSAYQAALKLLLRMLHMLLSMCRRQRKIHHTAAMITVDNNTLSSDLRQIAFLDNLSAS